MKRARAFAASHSGVAVVEFAIIVPMLILFLCVGFELSRYIKSVRQITVATSTVAGMIAQNTSGTVNDTDLLFFRDAVMIAYPDVLANAYSANKTWLQDIQITMSSVGFTTTPSGCSSSCTYKAKVSWSGGSNPRPCSVYMTSAPDDATPSTTTLPADVFGPGSLIAVDLKYVYRPIVGATLLGPLSVTRSFYIQPRYVSSVAYSSNGSNFATNCPSS